MKKELERALKAAGSVKGLARALRKSASTIRRWIRKGVPKRGDGRERLLEYKEERKAFRKQATDERKEAKRLMGLAKKISSLPWAKTGEGKREGPLTSGYRWTKSYRRTLTLDLLKQIEVWALGKKRRFPLWQLVVSTSQFSFDENFQGYERGTVQLEKTKEARAFAQDVEVVSPRSTKKSDVLAEVQAQLEEAIETVGLTVFVHSATLFNYRLRTDEERRAYETKARYARRKKQDGKRKQRTSRSRRNPRRTPRR